MAAEAASKKANENKSKEKQKKAETAKANEQKTKQNTAKKRSNKKQAPVKFDANDTPCQTCLAKCSNAPCKTWCEAHWCEGEHLPKPDHKNEIAKKLALARQERAKA